MSKALDQDSQDWYNKYASGPAREEPAMYATRPGYIPGQQDLDEFMRNRYGVLPKRDAISYAKPYPEAYDLIEPPPKFKIPDFTKFSGNEGTSTVEHISRYLAQLGPASRADFMRIRLFALSLTGPAFGWYTTLPPGSITTWK
jgi:hypothetical protein